ncbi:protein SON isoform X2 [Hippocampus comes]|uniref:protein SON isoform X2 n=1 Tax=Hippocampus comes TaxID=109280 RepID=UPI00094E3D83|nr:PREDICTED: protein SON-like isoform X2 [Hippocampus comes]
MAANIEQIFQDFILNKIREIEDQNVDKTAPQVVAACNEITSKDNEDKNCDDKSSKKKHKKHKKHKSKKKKRKREKEAKESSSESEEEFSAHSRKGAPTDNEQPCQGLDSSSRSHKHKTGKKKKKKKKRKRHKSERQGNSSDSDTKQRRSKCAPSLLPRPCEELPDIIPKQDSSSGAKPDGGKKRRSRSHSHGSHSSSEGWSSRPGKRKARSRSHSSSQGHRTSSRSLDTRDGLDPSTESKDDAAKSIHPLSPSSKKRDIEQQSLDHNHVPAETTARAAGEHSAEDCAAPPSVPNPSSRAQRSEEPVQPVEPRLKASEHISASARKSPAKKRCKPSKSPSRSREEKSSKRQKRSSSPCRTHRMRSSSRSRSRSSSRRKRSRSRSRNRRSRRSHSVSRARRRRGTYSQRDRWKREPSSSPELILRKKRSPTWKHSANLDGSQRISELGKEQLLEIAKANAAAMCAKVGMTIPASLRSSMLPLAFPSMAMNAAMTAATMTAALSNISTLSSLLPLPTITNKPPGANLSSSINAALEEVKKKVAKQANIISIKEFTDKCQMIVDSKGELPVAVPPVPVDEENRKPFGGLFLREHKAISFNVINTTVRPTARSDAGMAKEFPVSSGSQHRKKESQTTDAYGDWVPVEKTSDETKSAAVPEAAASSSSDTSESLKAAELPGTTEASAVDDDSVFPGPPPQPVDISQAVSERIKAQKRLAENPYDVNAICMLSRAQEQVDAWAQSNTVPGLFTGSTGAQVLSSEELSNSGPQAWLKKDQFLRAAPVSGGVGEFLMRKMGWRAGEGLGRNREGTVEPIIIDFKVDRKGLVAEGEKPQKPTGGLVVTKDLMGKHPVSALIELCTKKRMTQPDFVMVHHSGPDHRKNFLFKVTVNGADYQPQTASPNKKHAKAMAATVALQALGEVPADGPGLYTGPVFTAASTGPLFST